MGWAAPGPGGDDVVGPPEQSAVGVEDAGGLPACHGVAADEVHSLRQYRRALYDGGLDAAHVGDQGPGLEAVPVGLQEADDAPGVETQVDDVGLGQHGRGVVGEPVGHPMGGGEGQGVRVPVHPHQLIVLKAPQGHGHGPADEAQPDDGNLFFHLTGSGPRRLPP